MGSKKSPGFQSTQFHGPPRGRLHALRREAPGSVVSTTAPGRITAARLLNPEEGRALFLVPVALYISPKEKSMLVRITNITYVTCEIFSRKCKMYREESHHQLVLISSQ